MKIAILSFYSGFVNRGVEVFVNELALRLARKHEVTVFQTGAVNKKKNYLIKRINIEKKWTKDPTGSLKRFFFLDYYSRKIFQFTIKALTEIKRGDFEIILACNGGWQTLLTKLFSLLYGKKLAISGHAGIGWDDRFNLYCRPDLFIALSERGFLWAKKICPWARIVKIQNGVDLNKFNTQGKKAILDLQKPIILSVAALQSYKRLDVTIRAVACLEKASLLLIGRGDEKQEQYIDSLGVRLLGKRRFLRLTLPYQEMAPFYRSVSLFTLVSARQESFGIVYLEAMACGLPVVATDDSLRREIVGKAGLFVKEPINIKNYAAVLQKGLQISWKGIPRKQAEKFSWDKIAKEYEKVFLSLIDASCHPERRPVRRVEAKDLATDKERKNVRPSA